MSNGQLRAEPDALRAAAQGADDAAETLAGTSPSTALSDLLRALPGLHGASIVDEMLVSWRDEVDGLEDDLVANARGLRITADGFEAADQAAALEARNLQARMAGLPEIR